MIGSRLGPYEITAKLGEGGMGEVYRATDTRLGREVAIKVLPASVAQDPERLARFEREAKILASLNNAHIAAVYGLEEGSGAPALVMELVEGPTLADRIAQSPIPLDEALSIAKQIAEGLEYAHERGIIHRDLKPANIKLAPEGEVKLLDFGLAKALEPDAASGGAVDLSHSPTLTYQATVQGVILGTAAYMSPEQARGQAVDKRSDIWSFGVVLWEMLTGSRLFEGETVSDTLAAILTREPDLSALPASTPPALRRLLSRCLERNPKSRLRDIGDAALDMRDLTPAAGHEEAASVVAKQAGGSPIQRILWWPVVALAIVTSVVAVWLLMHAAPSGGSAQPLVSFEPKTFEREVIFNARFLPHDQGIVYSAATTGNVPELFTLTPEAQAPKKLAAPGTHLLSISDTGELAVLTGATYLNARVFEGTLAQMTLDGSPRPLVDDVREADWGPGGTLAIVRRVGGTDHLEYPLGKALYETSGYVSEPRVSPDGERVAFLDHQWWLDDRGRVKVVDRSGKVRTLSEEFWSVEGLAWSKDGRSLLFSGGSGSFELEPRVVTLQGVPSRQILSVPDSLTVLDVNGDGDWLAIKEQTRYGVVAHPRGGSDIDLTWLDACWGPSFSADGRTLLFTNGRGGLNYSVVTRRLDGSPITTLGDGASYGFSPDGAWVAANLANPPGVVLYPTGAGTPRHLELGPIEKIQSLQWFPDGKSLLISGSESSGAVRDYRKDVAGGTPEPVTPQGVSGRLRPDGHSVLAQDEHGVWELYPLGKGEPNPVQGLHSNDNVIGWDQDGNGVFVQRPAEVPARVERVDLSTGRRSLVLTIAPQERTGLLRIFLGQPVFDAAGDYSYGYLRQLTRLYVVHGAGS